MDFGVEFGFDKDQADGKWFDIDGMKVKMAYINSPRIEAIVKEKKDELSEKLGRELRKEEHEQVGNDVFVNHIILDWDKDTTDCGVKIECTPENVRMIIDKYPKFVMSCLLKAGNNKNFQIKRIEEVVGK